MLRICGRGGAVANVVMEVTAAADWITLSNDEDCVAYWIERHILPACPLYKKA